MAWRRRLRWRTFFLGVLIAAVVGTAGALLAWPEVRRQQVLGDLQSADVTTFESAAGRLAGSDDQTLHRRAAELAVGMPLERQLTVLEALVLASGKQMAEPVKTLADQIVGTLPVSVLAPVLIQLNTTAAEASARTTLFERIAAAEDREFDLLVEAADTAGWWLRDRVPSAIYARWLQRLAGAESLVSRIKLARLLFSQPELWQEPWSTPLLNTLLSDRRPQVRDAGLSVVARWASFSPDLSLLLANSAIENRERADRLQRVLTRPATAPATSASTQPSLNAVKAMIGDRPLNRRTLLWLMRQDEASHRDLGVVATLQTVPPLARLPLIDDLLRDPIDHVRLSGVLLWTLSRDDLSDLSGKEVKAMQDLMSRSIGATDRMDIAQLMRAGLWVSGGKQGTAPPLRALYQRYEDLRPTVLLLLLAAEDPLAIDLLFPPIMSHPDDLKNWPIATATLLYTYGWYDVLAHFLSADAPMPPWPAATVGDVYLPLQQLRDWLIVHRDRLFD